MSRLQAPGFSRLRLPGCVNQSSIVSPQQPQPRLPQPQSAPRLTQPGVFKRPQSIPTKPQDSQQIAAPRNDGQTFKKPLAPKQTALNSSSTKHGHTPYERNKQASSHIPYVGKKRATGSLKAPVSKGSYTGQEKGNTVNNENKPQTQSKIGQPIKRLSSNLTQPVAPKPPISAQEAANTSSDHKPIRRQLISDAATSAPVRKSSGGKQLKTIAKPLSGVAQLTSGIVQPRSQSQNTSRSSNNTSNNMSGGRALSRSLQTIPQNIKTKLQPKQGMSSKYASEESLSKNPNRTIQSNSSNLPTARQNGGMESGKFGFKAPSNFRPRALSQTLNKTVHMSTPCQSTTVKRDELKVSPIVTATTSVETTQATDKNIVDSKNRTLNVSLNQERPESLILDTEKELVAQLNFSNHSQDMSHDQSHNVSGGQSNDLLLDQTTTKKVEDTRTNLLGTTTLLLDDVMNKGNSTDFFNQTVVIRKPSDEMSFEDEKEISNEANKTFPMNPLNRTHAVEADLNQTHTKETPLNNTRILDQSGSLDLNKTHVLQTVTSDFNKTHVLNKHANLTQDFCNESNEELEEEMKVLYETFPVNEKSLAAELQEQIDEHISQSFSNSGNIPESEFIENVAMPSNLGKDTPCKSEIDDLNMEHSFTEDIAKVIAAISSGVGTHASASMVVSTSPLKSARTESEVTDVNVYSHGTVNQLTSEKVKQLLDIPISKSRTRESSENSDVFQDDEDFALVEVPKTPNHSSDNLPKTPSKTDAFCDYDARFDKRCNTVSLGMVKRPRNVRRHFTLGAQDLSKLFRAPKEMHTRETLEGNILMDNTTFLQLSNDVRSMKTQLLKLKRTLQEADCPSPLIKDSFKQSQGSPRPSIDGPIPAPLSPRSSVDSPLAVVDPMVSTRPVKPESVENKNNEVATLTTKFTEALRRIEELEKQSECDKYTIRLLQTQLENYEQKEQDILEENIILREQNGILTEKIQQVSGKQTDNGLAVSVHSGVVIEIWT